MKAKFSYSAYGLGIQSEISLPELPQARGSSDVWIRFGTAKWPGLTRAGKPYSFFLDGTDIYLSWHDAGVFLVRRGQEIIVDPLPEVNEAVIRLLLAGTLAMVLHQRGVLAIHASVVAINGQSAVAFLGEKGWGKSTLAAALHSQGHTFLSDDLLAIDFDPVGRPMVRPGFPQIKLWPDSLHCLGSDPRLLPRLHPDFEKRASQITRNFCCDSLPLQHIYVLSYGVSPKIETCSGQAALLEIIRHSQATRFLKDQGNTPGHFLECVKLINVVLFYQLKRPDDLNLVSTLERLVETHCQSQDLLVLEDSVYS